MYVLWMKADKNVVLSSLLFIILLLYRIKISLMVCCVVLYIIVME